VIVTNTLLRHYAEAGQMADRAIATFPEAADHFWNLKGRSALDQGDLKHAHAAAEKAGNNFPMLSFWVLYYEHNFAEAEAVSLSIWQGKDIAFARNFAGYSAIAARAAGATNRMRSYLFAWRQSFEPLLVGEPDPVTLSWVGVIDEALSRNEQALAECRRAVELLPISRDALEGPEYAKNLALVYAWAGERDRAIEQLSALAKMPPGPSYGELKLDPVWNDLRGDPRFEKIVADLKPKG